MVATGGGVRYRVLDVLQRGGERVDELVRQLRQETDGVHVEDGDAAGQLARVHRHVQRGEKPILGMQPRVARQRFDQRGFACGRVDKDKMVNLFGDEKSPGATKSLNKMISKKSNKRSHFKKNFFF